MAPMTDHEARTYTRRWLRDYRFTEIAARGIAARDSEEQEQLEALVIPVIRDDMTALDCWHAIQDFLALREAEVELGDDDIPDEVDEW